VPQRQGMGGRCLVRVPVEPGGSSGHTFTRDGETVAEFHVRNARVPRVGRGSVEGTCRGPRTLHGYEQRERGYTERDGVFETEPPYQLVDGGSE